MEVNFQHRMPITRQQILVQSRSHQGVPEHFLSIERDRKNAFSASKVKAIHKASTAPQNEYTIVERDYGLDKLAKNLKEVVRGMTYARPLIHHLTNPSGSLYSNDRHQ